MVEGEGLSDIEGEEFRLNWLSRILAETGLYKEVHRWAQEKVQEPDWSLVKERSFVNTQALFQVFACISSANILLAQENPMA